MPRIFVNFRNGDGQFAALMLYRDLVSRFGAADVFRSSSSIPLGDDYVTALTGAAADCQVLLAVVGPNWLTAVDSKGRIRIQRDDDWVRREIALAFAARRRVVPVVLDNVKMPKAEDLPDDIAMLGHCQYIRLNHRDAEAVLPALEERLRALVPGLTWPEQAKSTPGQHAQITISNQPSLGGIVNSPVNGSVNIYGHQKASAMQARGSASDSFAARVALAEVVQIAVENGLDEPESLHDSINVLREAALTGVVEGARVKAAATTVSRCLRQRLPAPFAETLASALDDIAGIHYEPHP